MIVQVMVNDVLLSNYVCDVLLSNVFTILYVVRHIIYFAGDNHFIQIEPNCKKFKRRNYSIYSNTL